GDPNFLYHQGWDSYTFHLGEGTWEVRATAGSYFDRPSEGTTTCTRNQTTNCIVCSGRQSYDLPFWAIRGNILGHVTILPSGKPGVGIKVQTLNDGPISPYAFTNSKGNYNFAAASGSQSNVQNNWGLRVYGTIDANTSTGPGQRTYDLEALYPNNNDTRPGT